MSTQEIPTKAEGSLDLSPGYIVLAIACAISLYAVCLGAILALIGVRIAALIGL